MSWAVALAAVVAFVVLADRFGLGGRVREVLARSRATVKVLRDSSLDDASKERAMRTQAGGLMVLFLGLTSVALLALALPVLVVWLLVQIGAVDGGAVVDVATSWSFFAAATAVALVAAHLLHRRRS